MYVPKYPLLSIVLHTELVLACYLSSQTGDESDDLNPYMYILFFSSRTSNFFCNQILLTSRSTRGRNLL